MFHGAGQAVRRSSSLRKLFHRNCFTAWILRPFGRVCAVSSVFGTLSARFGGVLRLACVLCCVVFVLSCLFAVFWGVCFRLG